MMLDRCALPLVLCLLVLGHSSGRLLGQQPPADSEPTGRPAGSEAAPLSESSGEPHGDRELAEQGDEESAAAQRTRARMDAMRAQMESYNEQQEAAQPQQARPSPFLLGLAILAILGLVAGAFLWARSGTRRGGAGNAS
jgi:hypothetical protein